MTGKEEFPLRIPEELRAELTRIYHDTYDTDLIEQRLSEEGITRQDSRDGWSVAYAYGPEGEDLGLVWSEPSYPEDWSVFEHEHQKATDDRQCNDELICEYDTADDTGDALTASIRPLGFQLRMALSPNSVDNGLLPSRDPGTLALMTSAPAWKTFDEVAADYDEVLPFFSRFGEAIVSAIEPEAGTRMLDIGAGRGALVRPALERGVAVTAIDASPGMVARLRADFPGTEAHVMDAQVLDFPGGAFDLATAAFVVHVLDDPAACVAEAFRVLAPGGRFAVTTGAAPDREEPGAVQGELDALFGEFSAHLLPGGGMGAPVDVRALMERTGFVGIEARHAEVSVPVPDGETLWRWALSHGYRAFIDDLPAERREAMRERMVDLPGPGAVLQRASAVLVGRRP